MLHMSTTGECNLLRYFLRNSSFGNGGKFFRRRRGRVKKDGQLEVQYLGVGGVYEKKMGSVWGRR